MAFFTGSVFSEALAMHTALRVIIPEGGMQGKKILYLLHGLSDDSSAWTRNTRIEMYAEVRGYAVVMPEVQRSFYTDLPANGCRYFTYVADELPALCENLFGFRHKCETTFVAGLSMGGYGAMKCGLSRPAQYAACASFSGAVDLQGQLDSLEMLARRLPEYQSVFGTDKAAAPQDDLFKLAITLNERPAHEKPRVFATCGASDHLLKNNHAFRDLMQTLSFDFEYKEWEGGHTWDFWDTSVQHAFDFFEHQTSGDSLK